MGCTSSKNVGLPGLEDDTYVHDGEFQELFVEQSLLKRNCIACTTKVDIHICLKDVASFENISGFSALDARVSLFSSDRSTGKNVEVDTTTAAIMEGGLRVCTLTCAFNFMLKNELTIALFPYSPDDSPSPGLADAVATSKLLLETALCRRFDRPPAVLLGRDGKEAGSIEVVAVEEEQVNAVVRLALRGKNLPNSDRFGKSDPYLRICRDDHGTWVPIFKSEVVYNSLSPRWSPIRIDFLRLAHADWRNKLKIQVIDYDVCGQHDMLGEVETCVDDLIETHADSCPMDLTLSSPGKPRNVLDKVTRRHTRDPSAPAQLILGDIKLLAAPGFMAFVNAGMKINLSVAIDFTSANGDPNSPSYMHNVTEGQLNQYEETMAGILDILEIYDPDNDFPFYGFGGVGANEEPLPRQSRKTFSMSGDGQRLVHGRKGLMEAYRAKVQEFKDGKMKPLGPRMIQPSLTEAFDSAENAHLVNTDNDTAESYDVLLLMAVGPCKDFHKSVNEIVKRSNLPLSIIIVGVGDKCEWEKSTMIKLDSDRKLLTYNGNNADRDIVQFVEYNACSQSREQLVAEMLLELPMQVISYTSQHELYPKGTNKAFYDKMKVRMDVANGTHFFANEDIRASIALNNMPKWAAAAHQAASHCQDSMPMRGASFVIPEDKTAAGDNPALASLYVDDKHQAQHGAPNTASARQREEMMEQLMETVDEGNPSPGKAQTAGDDAQPIEPDAAPVHPQIGPDDVVVAGVAEGREGGEGGAEKEPTQA